MKLRAIKDVLIAKVVTRSIEAQALVFGDAREGGRRHGAPDGHHHQRHRHRDRAQGGQAGQGHQAQGAGVHPGRRGAHHRQVSATTCRRPSRLSKRPTWACLCSTSTSASDRGESDGGCAPRLRSAARSASSSRATIGWRACWAGRTGRGGCGRLRRSALIRGGVVVAHPYPPHGRHHGPARGLSHRQVLPAAAVRQSALQLPLGGGQPG